MSGEKKAPQWPWLLALVPFVVSMLWSRFESAEPEDRPVAGAAIASPTPRVRMPATTPQAREALKRALRDTRKPALEDASPSVRAVATKLAEVKKCWQEGSCGYSEADSRADHFAAVEKIKALLVELRELAVTGSTTGIPEIARDYLQSDDDHVRAAALELLASFAPDIANLPVLLGALEASHSAPFYRQALQELARYPESPEKERVMSFLAGSIVTGSLYAGQEVATNLLPLLDDRNFARFKNVLDDLPSDSAKARALRRVLVEYQRLRAGG